MDYAEQIFNSSILNFLIPDNDLDLPERLCVGNEAEEFLESSNGLTARDHVFFDEKLLTILVVNVPHSSVSQEQPADPSSPPPLLLAWLKHLHVSLEASYIPQVQTGEAGRPAPTRSTTLNVKPTSSTLDVPSSSGTAPPPTPKPIPLTTDTDRPFSQSQGAVFRSISWAESSLDSSNLFTLQWSESQKSWIAVYKLSFIVSFIRISFPDPLLCLTASVTLRDKPISPSDIRRSLFNLIDAAGELPPLFQSTTDAQHSQRSLSGRDQDEVGLALFEVNVLHGLHSGTTFTKAHPLNFPSTRLSQGTRVKGYSLPAGQLSANPETPVATTPRAIAARTKSFRRVVKTASGFRVRMRTALVPVLFFGDQLSPESRPEGGGDERTVVLCVEIENIGDTTNGFSVEGVDVAISGEDAQAQLVGWGKDGFTDPSKLFPLLVHRNEQFNLLYSVTLLTPFEGQDLPLLQPSNRRNSDHPRSVAINITVRPFEVRDPSRDDLSYPTSSFSSRWNCTLNLLPSGGRDSREIPSGLISPKDVLPTPASPFLPLSAGNAFSPEKLFSFANFSLGGGSKRNTFAGKLDKHLSSLNPNYRSSMVPLSAGAAVPGPRSPPLPALPPGAGLGLMEQQQRLHSSPLVVSHPGQFQPLLSPLGQAPLYEKSGAVGPTVDIPREKMLTTGIPPTPGPHLSAPSITGPDIMRSTEMKQPIIISVDLVDDMDGSGMKKIYAFEEFQLEIFVFNQSSVTRRFEISYPDASSRQEKMSSWSSVKEVPPAPTVLPLENNVRIGPLRPSTSQSVRMRFIALAPGIHTLDTLVLTDIESGASKFLRSVMDIAVHNHD